VHVLLVGDGPGETLLGNSEWLSVYAIEGTGQRDALSSISITPFPHDLIATAGTELGATSSSGAAGTVPAGADSGAQQAGCDSSGSATFRLKVSPVKEGVDKYQHAALLGRPGRSKLGIGIDKQGHLFHSAVVHLLGH
jgi:hypothetical protein